MVISHKCKFTYESPYFNSFWFWLNQTICQRGWNKKKHQTQMQHINNKSFRLNWLDGLHILCDLLFCFSVFMSFVNGLLFRSMWSWIGNTNSIAGYIKYNTHTKWNTKETKEYVAVRDRIKPTAENWKKRNETHSKYKHGRTIRLVVLMILQHSIMV